MSPASRRSCARWATRSPCSPRRGGRPISPPGAARSRAATAPTRSRSEPPCPISRRSSLGVPVGVRANLRLALEQGRFDVVHGFEPGLPSISYLALRDSEALGVASFFSPERLGYPPRRALREKLLARIDSLIASSETTAAAAAERFPGDYRILSPGVDTELFRPGAKRKLVAIELHSGSLPVARAALRSLKELPGWEAVLLRTKPLSTRPGIPLALRDRVRVRSGKTPEARAAVLAEAAIVVPAPTGSARLRLEAAAAGAVLADPPGVLDQPELAAAALQRLAENGEVRERKSREGARGGRGAELRRRRP